MRNMPGPAKAILEQVETDRDGNFTPEQIQRFRADPEFYRTFVTAVEQDVNSGFQMVLVSLLFSLVASFATEA